MHREEKGNKKYKVMWRGVSAVGWVLSDVVLQVIANAGITLSDYLSENNLQEDQGFDSIVTFMVSEDNLVVEEVSAE